MAAAKHNLTIEQGATFQKNCQLSTGGSVEDGGTPISLVGAQVRMHIRKNFRTDEAYFELTSTASSPGTTDIYVTNASAGQFTITITDEDTAAIVWASAVYDLEVEYADGTVRRYLMGKVTVSKEVTRD
jgi:hypothetical protein